MTVVDVQKDPEALTLTFIARFDARAERVWQVWEDPRQLERWWGPPTWPATFERFEFTPGGEVRYHMTGPEGEKAPGWWRMLEIDPYTHLSLEDGFAGDDGEPIDADSPARIDVEFEESDGVTTMTTINRFPTAETMERNLAMGMEEGMRLAMGQIDDVLA